MDLAKFNFEVYKLLIQIQNVHDIDKFEKYLHSIDNMKHLSKTMGLWNYELDMYADNLSVIHKQITNLKNKFPKTLKKIGIVTHGRRLVTNKA